MGWRPDTSSGLLAVAAGQQPGKLSRMSDCELVIERIRAMSPDSTLQEILDDLALLATVRERVGLSEAGAGGASNDEVRRRVLAWTSK